MKKTVIKLLVCCIALSLTPGLAQAQFGSLGKRLKNRVENKIENKVDKAVDDVLDGKPNNQNSETQQPETKTAGNKSERSSRSRETGGITASESQEEQQLRYRNKVVLQSCESFLNFEGNYAFKVMRRDEDYAQLREKMTPEFLSTYFSTDKRNRNHVPEIEECRQHVAKEGFENAAYGELDRIYMDFDKKESYTKLVSLSEDFEFIGRVVVTNNSKLQKVTAYAQKLRDKLGAKNNAAMDKIACSPFHKQNMNKIFFTSNPNINPVTATASSFKNSFKAGEDIYGVIYFEKKIQVYMDGNRRILYGGLTIKNGEGSGSINIDYNGNLDRKKSYAVYVIYADASRYKNKTGSTYPSVSLNAEYLSKLPPRNYTIIANVGYDIKGSFEFDANDDSKLASMAATAKTLRARIVSNKKIPRAGMKNTNIERQLVTMFNSIGWSEKFKKAVITSTDYGYKRSATGRITGRTLSVLMFSKKSDGTCMYQDFTVIQPKTGSGYGSFRRLSTGSQSDIGCDKF